MQPSTRIVALAASAGGLHALTTVLSGLPSDYAAPIVVVQHLDPNHRSLLAAVLGRRSPVRVSEALEGEMLEPARVFVAPPDQHVLVKQDGTLSLTGTAPVHGVRPSADVLFGSMAVGFGERAIAVVLSGSGVDGTDGSKEVQEAGGTVIAQSTETAEFTGMPGSVAAAGFATVILPLQDIASELERLV